MFTRGQTDENGPVRAGRAGNITALLRACLVAIWLPRDAGGLFRLPGPPFWSVADGADRIWEMLKRIGQGGAPLVRFLPDVLADAPELELRCRIAGAGTFLAGLELTRDETIAIAIEQEITWALIQVRRGQRFISDEAAA